MEIRHIRETDDRLEISRIYEESWKSAYRDIIPRTYLDSIPGGAWAAHIDEAGRNTLVVLEENEYIGTASYCKSRFENFADFGEIVSIYLKPDYIGKGYGKKLFEAAIAELRQLGFHDIFLWVLEDNTRARKFYEAAGFVSANVFLENDIGGKKLREVQYRCR